MPQSHAIDIDKKTRTESIRWNNVRYSVTLANTEKVLLQGLHGEVKSGEMVAIMGGSGAGKSTLLNTLAGRIQPGCLSGDILVDGKPRNPSRWPLDCAYVEQDDIMYRNLSVEETLRYAAALRLPNSMTKERKEKRVDEVIEMVGLTNCRKTWIGGGDSGIRGVSGGERKRVSIALELIANPHILFLDEPTSGLDAFNAFNCIETLKNLCVTQKKIILMTIHQPRTDILDLFDKVILLSLGQQVFFGSTQDALVHFQSLGYPLPPKMNPSDFFLDLITPDFRSDDVKAESLGRIEKFFVAEKATRGKQQQQQGKRLNGSFSKAHDDIEAIPPRPDVSQENTEPSYVISMMREAFGIGEAIPFAASITTEISQLTSRNFVDLFRNIPYMLTIIGGPLVLALLFGSVFWKVTNDDNGIQNRQGLFFQTSNAFAFISMMPMITSFPEKRSIIHHERSSASYRAMSAYAAIFISVLPSLIIQCLIYCSILYPMVGLQSDMTKVLTFVLITFVNSLFASAFGMVIGSVSPSIQVSQQASPLIMMIFTLFSGLLVNLDNVNPAFRWIQWISFVAYTNKAYNQNEFDEGLKLTRMGQPMNGLDVIGPMALRNPPLMECIWVNLDMAVFYLVLGYFCFKIATRPLLKLK